MRTMRIKSIAILLLASLYFSCQGQELNKTNSLIKRLEEAENSKDINEIKSIFDDKAVLYTTELMPIKNKSGIASLYEFIFSRNEVENVEYKVDSTKIDGTLYYEYGKIITKKIEQGKTSDNFKAIFKKQKDEFKMVELSFGDENKLKKSLPNLLEPTGSYNIGQTTFFYDKNKSGNSRLLSFQIWYPTQSTNTKTIYQSKEVVEASANFLGFPLFFGKLFFIY